MNIIGRKREQDIISQCLASKRPEFMVVYGRRRVGKTYLVKEYFNGRFSFYATGIPSEKMKNQMAVIYESLIDHGENVHTVPKNWFEVFRRIKGLLETDDVARDPISNKRVIFLDEVPWMDTARSDFKSALDFFWNSWASTQNDLVLIVCGSATSWIVNNILGDNGGFYNRITRQLYLKPFSLSECREYFRSNGIEMIEQQVVESYMIFGGIPYYMNLFDRRLSPASNVDSLFFDPQGQLHYEYDHLFSSLFKRPTNHIKVIETLAKKKSGMLRKQLTEASGVSDGESLTKTLSELEQCGFIRKYQNYSKKKSGYYYQIIDPFVLFAISFLRDEKVKSWQNFIKSPGYYAWRGNAFELVCLEHIDQIKKVLGISGVETSEYSWRSKQKTGGAQIDLLIDRRDDMINICEMKFTDDEFAISKKYAEELRHKASVFIEETNPKKTVQFVLVTANGLKQNEYADVVQNVITGEQLFQ